MKIPIAVAALTAVCGIVTSSSAQTVQYHSPAGVEYRSQRDTGAIARAESALVADPRNIERIIALGVAQSGARQFRGAIETFTRGLAIEPNNAMLLRWRGHRYLSVREFDRAEADLTRGSQLDSTIYGIWYHLGVLRFVRGDFSGAADAFSRAQPRAPDAGELTGATDWLWMSLMRAGRSAEAEAMLARHPDSLTSTNAYARRLKLYRGEIRPEEVFTPADTSDIQVATLSYGLGNWYLVRGDTTRAQRPRGRSPRPPATAGGRPRRRGRVAARAPPGARPRPSARRRPGRTARAGRALAPAAPWLKDARPTRAEYTARAVALRRPYTDRSCRNRAKALV